MVGGLKIEFNKFVLFFSIGVSSGVCLYRFGCVFYDLFEVRLCLDQIL